MTDSNSNANPSDLNEIQSQIDALAQQRAALWDAAYQQINATQEHQRAQERVIQERRFAAQHALDAQIDALVQAYTGRVGLNKGDVVRFMIDYYNSKRGEFALVTNVKDDDVVVDLEIGVQTVPTIALALVIAPNLRDAWKLLRIAKHVYAATTHGYFDALNCLDPLNEGQGLLTRLVDRLGGAS